MDLNLRPADKCRYDAVSLGEVMLRLDSGEGRICTARSFRAREGHKKQRVLIKTLPVKGSDMQDCIF